MVCFDEPTNALDIDSIRWLETFLMNYEGALVMHDRHFLNAVCTKIVDIDYETIIVYPGNYDDMVPQKHRLAQHWKWRMPQNQKRLSNYKTLYKGSVLVHAQAK